jgi:hypothetical protein
MSYRHSITLVSLLLLLPAPAAQARNLMSADGPGGTATYALLQQAYSTELPDCGHMVPHITEEMDSELGKNVFVFHAHVAQDDDRCGAADRQRTEIRARAADIVASNGETVYYRWKFKLATGFQAAASFTHIFQIKSDQAAPVMTLTPRTSTFAIDGRIGARGTTSLAKFIGAWVVVDLKVRYANDGSVDATIRRLSNGEVLFSYSGAADMWDDGSSGHDSKFGIYRSLNNRGDLRDEQVRFADFCASKVSAAECADGALPPPDAGAPGVDAGGMADAGAEAAAPRPDAGGGGQPDAASGIDGPPPPPVSQPDAGGGTPSPDARPATPPRPDAAPTGGGPSAGESSGCSCSLAAARAGQSDSARGAAAGSGLLLFAFALVRLRRRRRR